MDRIPGGVTFIDRGVRCADACGFAQKRFDVNEEKKNVFGDAARADAVGRKSDDAGLLLAVGSDGKPLLVQLDKIDLSNVPSACCK